MADSVAVRCCALAWDQTDEHGDPVSAGHYRAHLIAPDFDTAVAFEIREGAEHVPFPFSDTGCFVHDQPGSPVTCRFRDRYMLSVQAPLYALGDTVAIGFNSIGDGKVWIGIER
ncbi:MAG: hypothetical protein Kow0074_20120 [Candidatus Zixiibacteriota bacterium]